jgi:hypothetical protein
MRLTSRARWRRTQCTQNGDGHALQSSTRSAQCLNAMLRGASVSLGSYSAHTTLNREARA